MYQVPSQRGKTIVVTGANSGTGKEIAKRLAGAGAVVIMAVRSTDKGEAARLEILGQHPSALLEVRPLDLANLGSVKSFADQLTREGRALNVLVNNAGIMMPPSRFETSDGFELQFATNFLGPFALTLRLLPLLLASPHARVSNMSSVVASVGRIRYDDPQWRRHYSPFLAYAQSKLADLVAAARLADVARERNWDLASNVAHPGYTRTNLLSSGPNLGRSHTSSNWMGRINVVPSQSVERGAEPMLYAVTSPDAFNGAYYGPGGFAGIVGPATLIRQPRSARRATSIRLWELAEELTGVSLPEED